MVPTGAMKKRGSLWSMSLPSVGAGRLRSEVVVLTAVEVEVGEGLEAKEGIARMSDWS